MTLAPNSLQTCVEPHKVLVLDAALEVMGLGPCELREPWLLRDRSRATLEVRNGYLVGAVGHEQAAKLLAEGMGHPRGRGLGSQAAGEEMVSIMTALRPHSAGHAGWQELEARVMKHRENAEGHQETGC